ncbi:MAG: hypothetical protein JXR60_02295 [Bacteroidales bacterium]|nr:hypothetical protein [Bacteroidales bacterium]
MNLLVKLIWLFTFSFSTAVLAQNQAKNESAPLSQQIADGRISLSQSYFNYTQVTQSQIIEDELVLQNNTEVDMQIAFGNSPDYIALSCDPKIIKPGERGVIRLRFDANKKIDKQKQPILGKDYQRIPLFIKGLENTTNQRTDFITVRSFLVEDFSHLSEKELKDAPVAAFDTLVFNYGKVKQGEIVMHYFIVSNKGKDELFIRYAQAC